MIAACLPVFVLAASVGPIQFVRRGMGPILSASGPGSGTWYAYHVANPFLLPFRGRQYFYYRGSGGPSAIGVLTSPRRGFDGIHWDPPLIPNPVIAPTPGAWDGYDAIDPAAVVFRDQVYLYYQGKTRQGAHGIGLATSADGFHFQKVAQVIPDTGSPCAAVSPTDGQMLLFYTRDAGNGGGFKLVCCASLDGVHFDTRRERTVLAPSGIPGAFDGYSLSAPRIWHEGCFYYMTYGGSGRFVDYPEGFGLARSADLLHWTRYPGNPIFRRGPAGAWDEGGIWSPALARVGGRYYLWYEGCGSGQGADSPASHLAREVQYGGYSATSFSHIGLATFDSRLTDWGTGP